MEELEAAAHTPGSPIMCNGGNAYRRQIQMMQALQLRVYNKSRFPKNKSDAPQQDNRINMDRGAGRRPEGRSRSKRTRTTQALTCEPFIMPIWRYCQHGIVWGFYFTFVRQGWSGCPHCKNHPKGDLSKLSLPLPNSSLRKKKRDPSICWIPILSILDLAPSLGDVQSNNSILSRITN
jgi:hypothetical protein